MWALARVLRVSGQGPHLKCGAGAVLRTTPCPPLLGSWRGFHGTCVLGMGRKSGSSALDPDPRELSKKQRRRKVRLAELRALSKDPKKEKLRMSFLKKQFDSPEMKAFVERTKLSVAEGLKELMLPDGLVQQQDGALFDHRPRRTPLSACFHPNAQRCATNTQHTK